MNHSAVQIVACTRCGLNQTVRGAESGGVVLCAQCRSPLEDRRGKSRSAALACAAATVCLLSAAAFEPLLTTAAIGTTRTSTLFSGPTALSREGWPLLGMAVFLFVFAFPMIRFASLAAVLSMLRFGRKPRWLGRLLRLAAELESWAMLDVFLVGLAIAFIRLKDALLVNVELGAQCFAAAAVLSLFVRAFLDDRAVWRDIADDADPGAGSDAIPCAACGRRLDPARVGFPCTRCGKIFPGQRGPTVLRSMAFLAAAALFYVPANAYPIAAIPIDFKTTAYTVLGGVVDLAAAHYLGLAALVFGVSFAIPIVKLAGLSWCALSAARASPLHRVAKTRVYRWLDEIGRWSMIDPFTIACFVPVLQFDGLIVGRAEAAVMPFSAVVILTMIAVKSFDPRLLWRAAETAR